ncbi:hypothetical protein [Saccharomonospora xinjiangensis]|uniref:hypothetical protein n=1 Tax=Saccharomonospora xinjiangensis TaxID=75294 RepID=UPI000592A1FA|nr:hypothetical protein [Saccharomonospora xinjiangensis]
MAPDLVRELMAGAEVVVESEADNGAVFVSWNVNPRLRWKALDALRHRRLNDPALQHQGAVLAAMAMATMTILTATGFTARDAENDMSPFGVQILDGPGSNTKPAWAMSADLTLPGWPSTTNPEQHPVGSLIRKITAYG